MKERLQKILSARGVASRRAAEEMIREGRVRLNGVTALLGESADPDIDVIEVDSAPLQQASGKVTIMLNKPRGFVTTVHDEKGRRSVCDIVRDCGARVYPIGRLDMNTEGLLLLTNDGELANILMHPSHEKSKTYWARVKGDVDAALTPLSQPMVIDGYTIKPAKVRLLSKIPEGGFLEIIIHEGRNRQVRKMCQAVNLDVKSLTRVEEGGLTLGSLKTGAWRFLTASEIARLRGNMQDEDRKIAKLP